MTLTAELNQAIFAPIKPPSIASWIYYALATLLEFTCMKKASRRFVLVAHILGISWWKSAFSNFSAHALPPSMLVTTEYAGRAFKMTPVVCKIMQKCKFSTMLAWQYFVALWVQFSPLRNIHNYISIRCNLCKEAIFSYFSLLLLNIFTIPHYCTLCKKRNIFITFPSFCCWKFLLFLIECSLCQWPHWLYISYIDDNYFGDNNNCPVWYLFCGQ